MLKGITLTLYEAIHEGIDEFGIPKIKYLPKTNVKNVLVAPSENDEIVTSTDFVGKKSRYILGIPKGDTNQWEDTIVEFLGHKYKTYGPIIQGIEENVPTRWHKKVMCERYE